MATRPSSLGSRPFGFRLGILGGGQLARMLCLKGHELGLSMHVLSRSAKDPAAQVATQWHGGNPDHAKDVEKFAREVSLVTIESEFHAGDMLAVVQKKTGTPMFPSPSVIRRLQDRLPQKESLQNAGVPTADFMAIHGRDDLELAAKHFRHRFVLKKRMGGYDGYGTFMVRSPKELARWREHLDLATDGFIAEQLIDFRRELAVVMARNSQGQIVSLPFVETCQVDHRLDWLRGPITVRSGTGFLQKLHRYLKEIDYVGTIAFELFDTGHGLIVNEIAPRVHNSGHASLEALTCDQFTLHLKAGLGDQLPQPALVSPQFAMVNLIGQGADQAQASRQTTCHLHWYGKHESRKGRKMGHLTWVGRNAKSGLALLTKERKGFKL